MKFNKSYGIICCKKNKITNKYEFLFIKRINSYAYITFVKGIYHNNYELFLLFDKMTLEEKLTIKSKDFKLIWFKCFLNCNEKDKVYIRSKKKFTNFFINNKDKSIFNTINSSKNIELIYEIPKGHPNKDEPYINAAIREFYEETNIHKGKYKILYNINPINYSFIDENINYIYVYYIAIMLDTNYIPRVSFKSEHMLAETSNIKFLSIDTIYIVNNDKRFIKMLKTVTKIVKKYILN